MFEKIDLNILINEIKNDQAIVTKIKNKKPDYVNKNCYYYKFNGFRCDMIDFINTDLDSNLIEEVKRMYYNLSEEHFIDELSFSNIDRIRKNNNFKLETYEEYLYKKIIEQLYNLYSEKNVKELLSEDFEIYKKEKKKKSKRKIYPEKIFEAKEKEEKKFDLEPKYKNFLSKY